MKKNFEAKIKRLFLTPFASWLFVALVVAGAVVMLVLLRQNRAHDAAESQRQAQLRAAAIADRAKLSAGLMEVLFSDVQGALTATLNAVPREGTLAFLERWREVNPLIADAVLVNALGVPDPGAAAIAPAPMMTDWLSKTPWHSGAVAEKIPAHADSSATVTAWEPLREKLRTAAARAPWHARGDDAGEPGPDGIATGNVGALPPSDDYTKRETWPERRRRLGIPFVERAGWNGAPGGLFAWRMCDDDIVLAVSVDLHELARLLSIALPAETQGGGRYQLLTDGGGGFSIHDELLPGWRVAAAQSTPDAGAVFSGEALYISASLLVVLAASLGILLLLGFQKRMRENEIIAAVTDYASHEMRTDVQEILCCTDPDALPPDADVEHLTKERAAMIYYASGRLSETVAFVLDFFPRVMRGGKLWTENVDVGQVAGKLLDEFTAAMRRAGIPMGFRSSFPGEPVRLASNETAISIILRNLIENACLRAPADNRMVELVLRENAATGMIELRVRDHGPGISGAELGRIFKPRWRPKDDERGHGIGLPLCRKLARSLGGDLAYETPGDGEGGNVFILSLANKNKQT
ncbi:signal transduction histidine kinase [Ereboglobus sp. PH5-5]|uniref:sensor histidine kinase n=1 Tax=Ereboglobus sp. PH5-5 TaxID=2940529 RepID=UPI00240541F0|nr:HAMP domain-containing sensor histidine kinase [Ereboglobus sp. PH5-5]MDF9833049.1 signal transduction histidine kinase [Ereboglobus sp. PH5-5]